MCTSCKSPGHGSSRSSECPNHTPTKDEILKAAYGTDYEVYARKVYLTSILRQQYHPFIERVTALSDFIRNVVFRAQLFVNYVTVQNKESIDHNYLKEQNFWYSVCQLIMSEKVTNKDFVNNFLVLAFDEFKTAFPSIIYSRKEARVKGHSDSLTAACVTLGTTYLNHIVENFKKRFFYYTYKRISEIYTVCIINGFCYVLY